MVIKRYIIEGVYILVYKLMQEMLDTVLTAPHSQFPIRKLGRT